ncbi:unnamed protein product [Peniophora sp. CBMAI 1063]|nr:unnamed protein product [Peniophora sp. CBMAI 1063]
MSAVSTLAALPPHYIVLGMGVVTFFTYEMPAYVHAALAVAFIGTLMIIQALSPDESDEAAPEPEQEEVLSDKPPTTVPEQESTPKSPAAARAAAIEMTVNVPPPSPSTSASSESESSSAYSVNSSAPTSAGFSFSSLPSTPRTPNTPGSARRTAFVRQLQRRSHILVDLSSRSRSLKSTPILVGLKGAGCARRNRRRSRSASRRTCKKRA